MVFGLLQLAREINNGIVIIVYLPEVSFDSVEIDGTAK
jgi:hypothetical protein